MSVSWRNRSPRSAWAAVGVAACAIAIAGCGGDAETANDFSDLVVLPDSEELEEIDLGRFLIPVPVVLDAEDGELRTTNLLQLDFELVGIVAPRDVSRVKRLQDRHAGKLRDQVIRVCRSTSRDEILESESATLKAHLLDALQPILGGSHLRGLVIPRWIVEPL